MEKEIINAHESGKEGYEKEDIERALEY